MSMTLLQIRTATLEACDMTSWQGADSLQMTRWINSAIRKVYNILADADDDMLSSVHKLFFADSKANYILPVDFYRLRKVLWTDGSGNYYPIGRFDLTRISNYNPESIGTYYNQSLRYRLEGDNIWFAPDPEDYGYCELHYIPHPGKLVLDADYTPKWMRDEWIDYVIAYGCIKLLAKEESDTMEWRMALKEEEAEIRKSTRRREENIPPQVKVIDEFSWDWDRETW